MGASITVEGWQRCNICDVAVVRMALHVLTKGNLEKGTALGLPEKNEHVQGQVCLHLARHVVQSPKRCSHSLIVV